MFKNRVDEVNNFDDLYDLGDLTAASVMGGVGFVSALCSVPLFIASGQNQAFKALTPALFFRGCD
jgi:hypothetical protein